MKLSSSIFPAMAAAALMFSVVLAKAETKDGPLLVESSGKTGGEVALWLQTSLERVFPFSSPGSTNLHLLTARNGKFAFQACLRNLGTEWRKATCSVSGADDLNPEVRLVGFVPVRHLSAGTDLKELDGVGYLPGLVPDPLFPQTSVEFSTTETRSWWITLKVPADAAPGLRKLTVHFVLNPGKQEAELPVEVEISPFVIQPRHDFHVTHWWRGEATWDYYHTGMFDKRWWEITRWQLGDMLDHGSDVVYVPMWFNRRETFKRPCQLLIVKEPKPGKYRFDWSRVKQFTDMSRQIGFKRFEWPHMWIYWGLNNPMRIYRQDKKGEYVMLWPPDTDGFSDTYLNFLKQFLPSFHDFLAREGLLESSYFHLSDEPGGSVDKYRRAREILREYAPWMKVIDALSDIRYGKQGLTDMPVPMVSAAQGYIDAKIPHWVYYCCEPAGPWINRFEDTPLPKIRMAGWLFYRLGAKGFLHWGFNYWDVFEHEGAYDPFTDTTAGGGVPAGDPFVIYPGADGHPIDSIRWEVFAQSLQDYAILQTAGMAPDDPALADIKTYAVFPKTEQWLDQTLAKILREHGAGGHVSANTETPVNP